MKLRANLSVRSVLPDKLDDFLQTDIIKGQLKKENPNEQAFFNETSIIARKEVPATFRLNSFLTYTNKIGMIQTLLYRCFRICSDWTVSL